MKTNGTIVLPRHPIIGWLLTCLACLGFAASLSAEYYIVPGTYITLTYTISGSPSVVTITDCNTDASGVLEIPSQIDGFFVTSIGSSAFSSCNSLTSVTIPNSVTSIGNNAFSSCTNLTSITIPNSVTSIGNNAFEACMNLTSVTIPNSVTSIGSNAFSWCMNLTSVTIPNSVTSIGSGTFANCRNLASVTIPNSVTSIGDWAFFYCNSLTSVTIPSSVTSIGSNAFSTCKSLTSVTIPNGVTSIESNAFSSCTSLTSVTIPNSVTSIESRAFDSCTNLTSVTIPNSVTSIGSHAFSNCTSLTSVTIPNSVTSIESRAFYSCTSLTSVTIPESVTSIGFWAFHSCTSLTSAYFEGNAPASFGSDVFSGTMTGFTIYYRANATGVSTPSWNGYAAYPTLQSIEDWRQSQFTPEELSNPAISGYFADPNSSGISNLTRYAFGLDRNATSSPSMPTISVISAEQGDTNRYCSLDFTIRTFSNLTYRVEVSDDMVNWHYNGDGTGETYVEIQSTENPDGTTTIQARDLRALAPAQASGIRVTLLMQ